MKAKLENEQIRMREAELITYDHASLSFDTESLEGLHTVAGVDVTFDATGTIAFAGASAVAFPSLTVLRTAVHMEENIKLPYYPGLLGFRESEAIVAALSQLQTTHSIDCVLVDGNGTLHSRGCGSACHVGIRSQLPTIGVAKSVMCVDGLSRAYVEHRAQSALRHKGEWEIVHGNSGVELCAILQPTGSSKKPQIISPGHKVSLPTAARVAAASLYYKTPEPIRAADLATRQALARA